MSGFIYLLRLLTVYRTYFYYLIDWLNLTPILESFDRSFPLFYSTLFWINELRSVVQTAA